MCDSQHSSLAQELEENKHQTFLILIRESLSPPQSPIPTLQEERKKVQKDCDFHLAYNGDMPSI